MDFLLGWGRGRGDGGGVGERVVRVGEGVVGGIANITG